MLHQVISSLLGIFDCNVLLIYCRVAYVLESDDNGMEDVGMIFFFLFLAISPAPLLAAFFPIWGIDASMEFWNVDFFVAAPMPH